MRRYLTLVIALVCGCVQVVVFNWSARADDRTQPGGIVTQMFGRWVSTQHVTFTNASLAGSSFYLDIDIASNGTFEGTWDTYTCVSYPGMYSMISCSRVQRPARARGKFDLTARRGEIELDQLGRTTFSYTLGTELLLELPRDWLKQGDAVLFTSKLSRPSK